MDTSVETHQQTRTGISSTVGLAVTAAAGAIGLAALLMVSGQPQKEWENYLTRMPGSQSAAGTSLENTNAGSDTNTTVNENTNTTNVNGNVNAETNSNANTNTSVNLNTNVSLNANYSIN